MLYEKAAYNFSIDITDSLLLKATNDLFDLSEDDQPDHRVSRLHQVHHIKHIICVTVARGGT